MPIGRNLKITPEQLSRSGYRLPTELEWEYACRAGTQTERFCCNKDKKYEFLLRRYAWYSENSGYHGHPVGQKRPNSFGLFDTLGHAYEWCVDVWGDNVNDAGFHSMLRGGAAGNVLVHTKYDNRNDKSAKERYKIYGLRIARTIKPDDMAPPPVNE
jgi:formylglycine-generating enzyme required for sulfatase activity